MTPALPERPHLLLAVKQRLRAAHCRALQQVNHPQMHMNLNKLAEDGILVKQKQVRPNYCVSQPLFELLAKLG